jgi:hypothetical protein
MTSFFSALMRSRLAISCPSMSPSYHVVHFFTENLLQARFVVACLPCSFLPANISHFPLDFLFAGLLTRFALTFSQIPIDFA